MNTNSFDYFAFRLIIATSMSAIWGCHHSVQPAMEQGFRSEIFYKNRFLFYQNTLMEPSLLSPKHTDIPNLRVEYPLNAEAEQNIKVSVRHYSQVIPDVIFQAIRETSPSLDRPVRNPDTFPCRPMICLGAAGDFQAYWAPLPTVCSLNSAVWARIMEAGNRNPMSRQQLKEKAIRIRNALYPASKDVEIIRTISRKDRAPTTKEPGCLGTMYCFFIAQSAAIKMGDCISVCFNPLDGSLQNVTKDSGADLEKFRNIINEANRQNKADQRDYVEDE